MNKENFQLNQKNLLKIFEYREDGELIWKIRLNNKTKPGQVAGCWRSDGRKIIRLFGALYYSYRLIFLFHKNELPEELDHIDGNPSNNRIENLRAASHEENMRNRNFIPDRRYKGVGWSFAANKWRAYIQFDGNYIHLGVFSNQDEAASAYNDAAIKYHKEFAKLNIIKGKIKMSMVYTHAYKVPTWIVLNILDAADKRQGWVLKALAKAGAKVQDWPGHTFPEYLLGFRKRGYAQSLPAAFPYNLDTALLLRACSEHIKATLSPTSYLGGAFRTPAHRIDRRVEKNEDFEVLFNSVLALEDDMGLSQIFQVAENCHTGKAEDTKVWVTVGPLPTTLLTRISNNVITIGDDSSNTICTSGLETKKDIEESLNNYFLKDAKNG